MPYYEVKQTGLTFGGRVYREGDVVYVEKDMPNVSPNVRKFYNRLLEEGHEYLNRTDARKPGVKSRVVNPNYAPNPNSLSSVAESETDDEAQNEMENTSESENQPQTEEQLPENAPELEDENEDLDEPPQLENEEASSEEENQTEE